MQLGRDGETVLPFTFRLRLWRCSGQMGESHIFSYEWALVSGYTVHCLLSSFQQEQTFSCCDRLFSSWFSRQCHCRRETWAPIPWASWRTQYAAFWLVRREKKITSRSQASAGPWHGCKLLAFTLRRARPQACTSTGNQQTQGHSEPLPHHLRYSFWGWIFGIWASKTPSKETFISIVKLITVWQGESGSFLHWVSFYTQ